MSYISEWKLGYLSDDEFEQCGVEENIRERAYRDELPEPDWDEEYYEEDC